MRIEIDQLPPPECSPNWRGHWTERHRAAKVYSTAVFYQAIDLRNHLMALDQYKRIELAKINLTFIFKEYRIRDRDNLVAQFKPGLDGLVRAGIIAGDDAEHLRFGSINIKHNRDLAPKTIIELIDEED